MAGPGKKILEQLLALSAEPTALAAIDGSSWPIVLANPAFEALVSGQPAVGSPLADLVEKVLGREAAREVSEAVRTGEDSIVPVELEKREHLLAIRRIAGAAGERYCAIVLREAGSAAVPPEMRDALLRAKRRIRELSRIDNVTGLLNEAAFHEVLSHDWAVARREQSRLALLGFSFDDLDAYRDVFGDHATNSALRRVAGTIRRFLRRASDVSGRVSRAGTEIFLVLSHASEEKGADTFAEKIAAAVRDLGLHHPRSTRSRFVTVTCFTAHARPGRGDATAEEFLEKLLGSGSPDGEEGAD